MLQHIVSAPKNCTVAASFPDQFALSEWAEEDWNLVRPKSPQLIGNEDGTVGSAWESSGDYERFT